MSASPVAYSVSEFLKAFAIGRTKFYQEINSGRLKARKLGTRTVVLASDAATWAAALPELRCAPKGRVER